MSRTSLRLRTAGLAAVTALVAVPFVAAPAHAAAPTVASVSPSSRAEGSAPTAFTVTGLNLVSNSIVNFVGGGVLVTYAQGGSVANANGTTLSGMTIEVVDGAATGARQVTVTSPDASTGSCNCFTVTAGPTITSVTPSAGNPGQSVNVVISGTGFQSGAAVTAGNGITVTNVSQPSGSTTTINATFTIANNAFNGARDVTVTNPDGSTAVRPNGFVVGSAVSVTGISPNTRGRGAQNQPITITGNNFAAGATVAFSGGGITFDSTSVINANRIDVVIDIAPNATVSQRNVTVTNPGGLSGTCTGCFNVTANPTVTAANPSTAGRGRQALDVVLTGTGFLAGATVSFGPGVTVTSVSVGTTLVVRINVAVDAALGTRDIVVTNPDGGTGTCTSCFTVTAGRAMVIEVIDTKGTVATGDDVVTTRPVSGTTYAVRVTAKQTTANSQTDTAYTGTPVLTSTDTTFAAGNCGAAVSGVATCTGVRFGDLGAQTLLVRGASNADSDRNGSVALVVQPVGLAWTAAPTSGEIGESLTYTVAPVAGVNGAKTAGYAATRTLLVTGGGSSIAPNTTLTCTTAVCSFTLSFSTAGTKTVAVTDNSTPARTTPVVTVEIAPAVERGTYTPLVPSRILDTRSANDTDGFSAPVGSGGTITVQVAGRGGVPSSGVAAVVVNATAVRPTTAGFVTLFPGGTTRPNASTLNFRTGQVIANLATVKLGNGQLSVYNLTGATDVVLDVVGWYSTTPATTGGRTIAVTPARILDTRPDGDDVSSPVGPNSTITRQVLGVGGVPASGVAAVLVNVTAVRATASTFVTAYPSDAALPTASTLNVDPSYRIDGRVPEAVPNLAIVKVGGDGKIALYNKSGSVDLILDVVGYVSSTSTATAGRFVALPPLRVLDTRTTGDGEPFATAVAPDSAIDLTVLGRGGVPATGVTAVVLNVTAVTPTATTYLTVYPSGQTRPLASNVNAVPGQTVPNLVVVKVGSNGQAAIYNRSGFTHVVADVVGYLTS